MFIITSGATHWWKGTTNAVVVGVSLRSEFTQVLRRTFILLPLYLAAPHKVLQRSGHMCCMTYWIWSGWAFLDLHMSLVSSVLLLPAFQQLLPRGTKDAQYKPYVWFTTGIGWAWLWGKDLSLAWSVANHFTEVCLQRHPKAGLCRQLNSGPGLGLTNPVWLQMGSFLAYSLMRWGGFHLSFLGDYHPQWKGTQLKSSVAGMSS